MIDEEPHKTQKPAAWLFSEVRLAGGQLLRSTGFAVLAGLLIVWQARLLATACQRVVIEGAGALAALPLAGAVALLALARSVLIWFSEQQSIAAAGQVKQRVRALLYSRIQERGPAGRNGAETGALVEAVTSGIEGLEPYIVRFLPQCALAGFLPLIVLFFVLPVEWRSGLVLLFSAPFIPLFMILIGRGSEVLHRRQWGRLSRMAGYLLDLVQGLPDLRIFGAAKREAGLVARVSESYRQGTMAILRVAFLSAFTLEFFATIGTAIVAVVIGFRLLEGGLALADGLFVLLLAPEFYLPLRNLGLSYHSRMQGVAAAEQLLPLLALPLPPGYTGLVAPPITAPAIVFEDVSFCYKGNRGGVKGINLNLPPGSLTALAGESGAGKTTLLRLLVGLMRPDSGRITVNGIDLLELAPDAWQARIAWVPQKPFFFKGSIRANLLLGRPDACEGDICAALEKAAAAEFISLLPDGAGTELGDNGAGLSGGELKRLALARAFLRQAPLVVLDEPTAGLDAANERLVLQALERLAMGRTMLVISHREETLLKAGQVAALAGGCLERVVSPEEFFQPKTGTA